jgi:hypothetical protein
LARCLIVQEKRWCLTLPTFGQDPNAYLGLARLESQCLGYWSCVRLGRVNRGVYPTNVLYACHTCNMPCICKHCAVKCHRGHDLGVFQVGSGGGDDHEEEEEGDDDDDDDDDDDGDDEDDDNDHDDDEGSHNNDDVSDISTNPVCPPRPRTASCANAAWRGRCASCCRP